MSQRSLRLVGAFLLGLAILLFFGYFLIYLRYTAALLQFPFDYDQGEGFELNDSVLMAGGEWPYRSNEVFPFYASNYPPLYHIILVPFVWAFGPAYWYGRLVAFLSTLVTALAIGYAVHRASRDKPISLLAGLAFLASNYVYHIGPLFRQHIVMVMFETLAIVILAPLSRQTSEVSPVFGASEVWRVFWGLLCLLAAGYTKQLAYATVAVALLFIITRGVKRGLVASAAFTAVAAILFGLINLATGGQWWVNIILANINEFIPGQAEGLYRQWHDLHLILIWLAVIWVVLELARRRVPLYALWFAGAVANGALAGKWGAGESYFTTSIAAMCICAGLLMAEWRGRSKAWPTVAQWATAIAVPALFIAQAGRLIHMPTQGRLFEPIARALGLPVDQQFEARGFVDVGGVGMFVDSEGRMQYYDSQGYTQLGRPPNRIDSEQGYKILAYTRPVDGPVLTEEAAFSLLAGKEQAGNPTQLLNLAKNSMLDSSAMVNMINAQSFDVIVLKAEFYPRSVLIAIGQNYEPVETIIMNGFNYRILKPKGGNNVP
ncbi:MAG: hypothetical protein HYZ49_11135 [Chloroflexi bacterium]|nr:hypothetical protein [Chloroflexota bacterium]